MISANKLVGLMAEPDRRRVIAALILSAGNLDDIVKTSGLKKRQTVDALERLITSGLVETSSTGDYVLLEAAFKRAARAQGQSTERDEDRHGVEPDERVLKKCIVDGRLVHIPRKRAKRLILLNHLAQGFEPGQRYSEREVNAFLRAFDDDVATLRRYLVDDSFLDRSNGEYWRSGGEVDIG